MSEISCRHNGQILIGESLPAYVPINQYPYQILFRFYGSRILESRVFNMSPYLETVFNTVTDELIGEKL